MLLVERYKDFIETLFSETKFPVLHMLFSNAISDNRRCVSKTQERFLFNIEWPTKNSFSFSNYIMDYEIYALSQDLLSRKKQEKPIGQPIANEEETTQKN